MSKIKKKIFISGPKRPLVVVGNKTDLLQDWSRNMLDQAKRALIKQLPSKANVLHTTLVSAKTGFGIEQLITTLYKIWEFRGVLSKFKIIQYTVQPVILNPPNFRILGSLI